MCTDKDYETKNQTLWFLFGARFTCLPVLCHHLAVDCCDSYLYQMPKPLSNIIISKFKKTADID